jgi:large subunit ribosomal protein L3
MKGFYRKGIRINKSLKFNQLPTPSPQTQPSIYDLNNRTNSDDYTLKSFIKQLGLSNDISEYKYKTTGIITYNRINEFNKEILEKSKTQLKESQLNINSRRIGLIGTKIGMTCLFTKWGSKIPLSVIKVENNQIISYNKIKGEKYLVQVGSGFNPNAHKALKGQLYKNDIPPKEHIKGFRITPDCLLPIGFILNPRHFKVGQFVDIQGISKGKGTQGVMYRWNFKGGVKTHGASLSHRTVGSIGNREFPARVWPGKKMAGKTGNEKIWVRNLKIYKADYEKGLFYVKGAIPGNKEGKIVMIDSFIKAYSQHKLLHSPTFIPKEGIEYKDVEIYEESQDDFEKYAHDNDERLGISDEEEEGPAGDEEDETEV